MGHCISQLLVGAQSRHLWLWRAWNPFLWETHSSFTQWLSIPAPRVEPVTWMKGKQQLHSPEMLTGSQIGTGPNQSQWGFAGTKAWMASPFLFQSWDYQLLHWLEPSPSLGPNTCDLLATFSPLQYSWNVHFYPISSIKSCRWCCMLEPVKGETIQRMSLRSTNNAAF